ncbi:amidohydrolase family protein [Kordiimonas sp.]|uniref:amidohydrolase family protein n=1 Tax=Kordiimonas sp. TaxID=1970157 RepID=UPI003A933D2D
MYSDTISRRHLLKLTAALLGTTALAGCFGRGLKIPPGTYKPKDDDPLHIDTHAHIFNAEDLPIRGVAGFLTQTHLPLGELGGVIGRSLAFLLEVIVQAVAPGFKKENEELDAILDGQKTYQAPPQLKDKDMIRIIQNGLENGGDPKKDLAKFREHVAITFEKKRRGASFTTSLTLSAEEEADFGRWQTELGEEVLEEAYRQSEKADDRRREDRFVPTTLAAYALAIFIFYLLAPEVLRAAISSHIGNAHRLMRIFGEARNGVPAIDLFVTAEVDMDIWVHQSHRGSKNTQIETQTLMEKIALATDGRMLPFASFDPLREVVTREKNLAHAGSGVMPEITPLELAKRAVLERGFVGIKLYPAMGFKPYFNVEFDADEHAHWPKAGQKIIGLGAKLDAALFELYRFCLDHDVPVMCHANTSMYSHRDYKTRGQPKNWQALFEAKIKGLEDIKNLRLNLGHLARIDTTAPYEGSWVEQAATTIAPDNRVFADFANYDGVHKMAGQQRLQENLRKLYAQNPGIGSRVMFGTDWWMLASDKKVLDYVDDIRRTVSSTDGIVSEKRFLGGNAVDFLGLRPGDRPFERLRSYYANNPYKVIEPKWLTRAART